MKSFYVLLSTLLLIRSQSDPEDLVTLTSSTFEHTTQVATGATTGDWFVLFHKGSASCCASWLQVWQQLATTVQESSDLQLSIAKVDGEANPDLIKRFNVSMPSIIYFRLGKMYRVVSKPVLPDLLGIVKESKFKNFKAESVPKQLTVFSDFSLSALKTYPYNVAALGLVSVVVLFAVLSKKPSNDKKTN